MSADAHTVADDQVRSAFQRWKNLEGEKARIGDDLKELFAEQKAFGHDTKAMRAAFRLKVKIDEASPEDAEHEALVDTYLAALEAPRASRAYARENIEQFDANPRLIKQVVDGMQTEAGRAALIAAVDIMIEREEADEFQAKASGDNGATEQDIEDTADSVTGDAVRSSRGDDSPAPNPEMDRATEGSFETGSEAAEKGRKATATVAAPADLNHAGAGESPAADQPLTGGDHEVTSIAERDRDFPTSNTGEGAACALPAKSSIRPLCRNPGETCGGYGRKHCRACEMAAAELEAAE